MARPAMIAVEDLRVSFTIDGRAIRAVDGATFQVEEGRSVGIVGESGSGKSTLARALLGLLPGGAMTRVEGELRVDGTPLAWREVERLRGRSLAIVFQDPLSFLDPLMRIGRQIGEVVRLHDAHSDPERRTAELLGLVNLSPEHAHAYPHELSGGMRQRVLLAIALACGPRLLVADEPTTALDVTTQKEILDLIRDVRVRLGMGLLLISHDLAIVASMCEHVHVMHEGRIIESGATRAVFASPRQAYTTRLLAAARRLDFVTGDIEIKPVGDTMTSVDAPVLEIVNVSKSFARRGGGVVRALKNVSLQVSRGETLAIVGESGSGKSTLARVALALLRPDTGDVRLRGRSLVNASARELRTSRTAMQPIFQDSGAAFNPRRTVRQLLAQAFDARALPRGDHAEAAIAVLEQVKLAPGREFLDRFPHELSGGQRQRLAIARALATEPMLILADEPLSGADLSIRARIVDLLREIQERRGVAYLFITHDIALARSFAHRVAVMHQGEIVEQGPARALIARPAQPYTRRLIDSVRTLAPMHDSA